MSFRVNFDDPLDFVPQNYKPLNKIAGLYFISVPKRKISYPFRDSRLIYIGMSEKITNSMYSRLSDHYEGRSGNIGLTNYRKMDSLVFTYLNFEVVRSFWNTRVEDLESAFIIDFVKKFGVYPICNNKTGSFNLTGEVSDHIEIDWDYFD